MKQYTLLTNSGINKLLKTASDGSKIALKEIVVSDYDGELSEQTASIPNEKYRGAINAITIDENDNNILDVDAIIPPEVGGFYIKTAGIFCDDGSLFAVARLADTYKPLLNEGSSKDITLNFKLQIANASDSIVLKVDNNVVLATRKWSENQFLKKTDKIDAYTKRESDDKFVLKTDLNQTLQNVTSQRQAGEIYTNNTGKPIFISVVCQANNQGDTYEMKLEINGIAVQKVYGGATTALTPKASICGVIPAGATYKITTYNNIGSTIITDWAELR